MTRFRFSLEKVLKLRQHLEQEAKIELGKAIGALTEIEGKIKLNALARAQSSRERFSGISSGGSGSAGALLMFSWNGYMLRLEQEAERLAQAAASAEAVVEEKRGLYMEAARELKVIEKLREKRKSEHRKEMFAAQVRELDDARRAKIST